MFIIVLPVQKKNKQNPIWQPIFPCNTDSIKNTSEDQTCKTEDPILKGKDPPKVWKEDKVTQTIPAAKSTESLAYKWTDLA